MTNQKAIKILREKLSPCLIAGEWKESVDAAISALQAQDVPDTNVGDMISKQAAIDAIVNCTNCEDEKTLRTYVQKHNLDNEWTGGILEALNAIEDLPSAQPEIVRCKDCLMHGSCRFEQGLGLDGYCSQAERRTDD